MIIYIDVFIFINLLVNYCILCTSKKFLNLKTSQFRLILASLIAGVLSLIVFAPIYIGLVSYLFRFAITNIVCCIAFTYSNFITYIKVILSNLVFSIIFSGTMIFIYQTAKPKNMAIINDMVYFDIKPATIIIISIIVYITFIFIKKLFSNNLTNTLVNLCIIYNGLSLNCVGKIDTGCSVVEPFSGCPVIIVEKKLLTNHKLHTTRLIPYKALGNSGILHSFKADKILIDNKEINKDVYIAIYNHEIDSNIKAIINSQIIG